MRINADKVIGGLMGAFAALKVGGVLECSWWWIVSIPIAVTASIFAFALHFFGRSVRITFNGRSSSRGRF